MIFSITTHLAQLQEASLRLDTMTVKLTNRTTAGERQVRYALNQIAETIGLEHPLRWERIVLAPLITEIVRENKWHGANISSFNHYSNEATVDFFATETEKRHKDPHRSVVFFAHDFDTHIDVRDNNKPILFAAPLQLRSRARKSLYAQGNMRVTSLPNKARTTDYAALLSDITQTDIETQHVK
jgi:uncharacterized protein (UPF0210 family)